MGKKKKPVGSEGLRQSLLGDEERSDGSPSRIEEAPGRMEKQGETEKVVAERTTHSFPRDRAQEREQKEKKRTPEDDAFLRDRLSKLSEPFLVEEGKSEEQLAEERRAKLNSYEKMLSMDVTKKEVTKPIAGQQPSSSSSQTLHSLLDERDLPGFPVREQRDVDSYFTQFLEDYSKVPGDFEDVARAGREKCEDTLVGKLARKQAALGITSARVFSDQCLQVLDWYCEDRGKSRRSFDITSLDHIIRKVFPERVERAQAAAKL